ncbi:hypothetical protein JRQ81_000147 [Phrynocephalus forsythii]|uniref:C-type lectin domain-containing protein n=1 Tax=Phrynocephalus forsythii TaxID=171643 RepID=A0A9Q0Y5H6_9SAUR|nr:hypothetical protein JRQ81_000147 [Phrynocephalus forsythii]
MEWYCGNYREVNFIVHSSQMACQSYSKNSHLASIHSAEENDFIFYLMGQPLDYTKGQAYWIGAHDTFQCTTLQYSWIQVTSFGLKGKICKASLPGLDEDHLADKDYQVNVY